MAYTERMDARDITATLAQRMANQHLTALAGSVHGLMSAMGAIQAQDYYAALWAIGLRTGLTAQQVIAAVEARQIVRTWPQRGTLHYVGAEDVAWMTALSAGRLFKGAARRRQNLGLDQDILDRSKQLFGQALEGGRSLTRPQMLALLEADGISTQAGRGYHMLWYAAQTGLTYIGPMEGRQQTFGLVQDLPVAQRQLSREESLVELARRYVSGRAPVTLPDFMWWSGLSTAEARQALEAADAEATVAKPLPPQVVTAATLLPAFDEYILGYKDRSAQLDAEHSLRVVPGGNGMFMPTLLIEGRVAGIWKRVVKKNPKDKQDQVHVSIEAFRPLTAAHRVAVETQALAYGVFLGFQADAVVTHMV